MFYATMKKKTKQIHTHLPLQLPMGVINPEIEMHYIHGENQYRESLVTLNTYCYIIHILTIFFPWLFWVREDYTPPIDLGVYIPLSASMYSDVPTTNDIDTPLWGTEMQSDWDTEKRDSV